MSQDLDTMATEASTMWRTAKPRSFWGDAYHNFIHNRSGMLGLVVLTLLLLAAIFAQQLAPFDYLGQDWKALLKRPNAVHWMGTDDLGRDVFSRVLMGGRTALLVGLLISLTSTAIGLFAGALSAFLGGWIDRIIVWVMDGLLSFPSIWLAAFVSVATRPTISKWSTGLYNFTGLAFFQNEVVLSYLVVVTSIGLVAWPYMGRLIRSQVLSLREKEFIEAERALGARTWWITLRHLIPNVLGSVIVTFTLSFGNAMLYESSLSFLGIGIQPPGASWGRMIYEGLSRLRSHPYLILMPGITLSIVVLSLQLMGDALNDALNPRNRTR
jgi:oligopeptide transport system permease protein